MFGVKIRFRRILICLLLVFCASSLIFSFPAQAASGPALTIDASTGKLISPYIYGMNFADAALAQELALPVRRWGGNATTRYNYMYDTSNRASDWYFENIGETNSNPSLLPNGSSVDKFVEQDRSTSTKSILTMPLIGWTPKARDASCGFSVAKYGAQQSTDQWRPDCGNGVKPDGTNITGNDPKDTSVAIGPDYVQGWMQHLIANYGTAANGGVMFYNLDNEPDLWHSTHRDVHPIGASYDEMRDQTYAIASVIKATDPNAQTLGPVGWGYNSLLYSGLDQSSPGSWWNAPPDRNAHGGTPFADWYLQQMKAYEQAHGVRILDYLDDHIYPQQANVTSEAVDATTAALRLRSTRQLWDPTYVDESWINTTIQFIPRLKSLVATNYPGTKTAITEYNWGALGSLNGALTEADILGIFGREGLDLATMWSPPTSTQPAAYAFRMYRNYDGKGGKFGDTSVSASSADQSLLSVYAAKRTDGALTLIIINKDPSNDYTSSVSIAGFPSVTTSAKVYRYSNANLNAIVAQSDQSVVPGGPNGTMTFSGTFPAYSVTLMVIPYVGDLPPTYTNTPKATATCPCATITRSPTPTVTPTQGATAAAGLNVSIKSNGTDNNQQTAFSYQIKNTGSTAQSGISTRIYFTLDGTNAASNYSLEKYYDQSGTATISGPTLASGNTYYFTVNYGTAALTAGSSWEFQSALHLSNWGTNFSGSNDWFHSGYAAGALPAAYTTTMYIPAYISGSIAWGSEPGTPVPTNTPTPVTPTFLPPSNTPGITISPTFVVDGPDLTVDTIGVGVSGCTLYTTVKVSNKGMGPAGMFVVTLNGVAQTVNGLSMGTSVTLQFAGFKTQNTAIADANNQVAEVNETNNSLSVTLVPPPIAACTPTVPPPTNTSTPFTPDPTPLPPTWTPTPSGSLKVQYKAADTNATDNQIKPHFTIVNMGSSAVDMKTLKIRYYFTKEAGGSMAFNCDWAVVGCSNITGTFGAISGVNADTYLEVSFTGGTIAANSTSGEIQTRLNKSDWTNFNESNDYSFDSTKISFTDWNKVTLYQGGVLVWGVPPITP